MAEVIFARDGPRGEVAQRLSPMAAMTASQIDASKPAVPGPDDQQDPEEADEDGEPAPPAHRSPRKSAAPSVTSSGLAWITADSGTSGMSESALVKPTVASISARLRAITGRISSTGESQRAPAPAPRWRRSARRGC
jgi:hypothetical protein